MRLLIACETCKRQYDATGRGDDGTVGIAHEHAVRTADDVAGRHQPCLSGHRGHTISLGTPAQSLFDQFYYLF